MIDGVGPRAGPVGDAGTWTAAQGAGVACHP
jgi:hypothetical protein